MKTWSHRLGVRTSDSHSGNTGSIPVGTAKIKDHCFGGLFIFSIFLMSDIFFDNIHAFDYQSCLPDMRTEPSFRCILP